jgi:uncharacterized protein (TIGR02246 family)
MMDRNFLRARGLLLALALAASVALAGGCRREGDAAASPTAGVVQNAASDPNAPDPRITGEAEIRALDAELQKAIIANDAAKAATFFDDAATVMVPGQSAAQGNDHVAREFTGLMALPGFAFTFTPETVMVARSGEMAYEYGTYAMTYNDKDGKPAATNARYVAVWTKAADGSWKILIDAPTTTR